MSDNKISTTDWATRIILELLRSGETVRFQARGHSMWPTIPSHSRIEVRPSEAAEIQVGQIAAFERQGRVIVHRVRAVSAECIELAGDALKKGDGSVAREHVLGRAHVLRRRPLQLQLPKLRHLRILVRALSRRVAPTSRFAF
ncbi:MAG TPA: S24/S26 family peptidase [Polyangiaceae bacterium]|nr:S24/S26 family peptidase [Polyangiaceae bacterium]